MKMPEASVTLVGQVFLVTPAKSYSPERDDLGHLGAAKIGVLGVGGATEVKLDDKQMKQLRPIPGDTVAWQIQPAPYSVDGNNGVTFKFVGLSDLSTVDALHNAVAATQEPASK